MRQMTILQIMPAAPKMMAVFELDGEKWEERVVAFALVEYPAGDGSILPAVVDGDGMIHAVDVSNGLQRVAFYP